MFNYEDQHSESIETLSGCVRAGKLNPIEHISHGIETMPDALANLYLGYNAGARMVQVGEPS